MPHNDAPDYREPKPKMSDMHVLELIPFFRRWRQSWWRDIIYSLIFKTLIATIFVGFSLFSRRYNSLSIFFNVLWESWIASNIIGFTFYFVYTALGPLLSRIHKLSLWGVVLSYTLMGIFIFQLGVLIASRVPGFGQIQTIMLSPQGVIASALFSFLIALMISLAWRKQQLELQRETRLAQERQRLETAERAAAEANLRALQAQIEPHFLFNTLANVVGLIHPDPSKAKHMLEQFILYLRATLAETRAEKTTLAREFELMKNFLAVLQIRMGERLTVNLDLPADLHDYPIPPMLLQPLVENAIKHGLEPNINGGNLTLHAEQREHRLIIIIADTGVGFKGAHSAGIGLKNVRERLTQLYGDAARLHIEETHPAGTTVILNLPLAWKPLIKPTLTEDPKL